MHKHTPGPWQVVDVVHVYSHDLRRKLPYNGADARLIAAAPDLLNALEMIMAKVAGCERNPEYEAARAAIAKVKGQS